MPGLEPDVLRAGPKPYHLLLVEDDPGDALLVQDRLPDLPGTRYDVSWARSVAEAELLAEGRPPDCALVDLGLPDATGLDALHRVVAVCTGAAVIVLTGLSDRNLALEAVAAGAQDYLIKDEVNTELLDRTLRLAMARRAVERSAVSLAEAALRQTYNERMAHGLLPQFRLRDPLLRTTTRYQPGAAGEVIGGDFLDAVELDDGTVSAIIGDVAGHGPDAAAAGVNLRIAWRALTLAGSDPAATFVRLNDQIINDTGQDEIFATVAHVTIAADRRRLTLHVAGHPVPILLTPDGGVHELDVARTVFVGFCLDATPPAVDFDLPPSWRLLLYTDGLVEGLDGDSTARWGAEGLVEWLRRTPWTGSDDMADAAIAEATRRNGRPLQDDVAILVIDR